MDKPTHISDQDRTVLELAKARKLIAQANAEKAVAQNESAETNYRYLVLQIYMKYNLTQADALNENGEILYAGGKDATEQT